MKVEYTIIAKVDGNTVYEKKTESEKLLRKYHKDAVTTTHETIREVFMDRRGRNHAKRSVIDWIADDYDSLRVR
jgi:hypothetical protein